ncbi:MAG: hypothetical protein ACRC8M_11510 [Cetobacterium sp.]|uniref:hypothetical protein n=1 Tax=Cetobacterium sp. TaxID=2071632 RepID=UPI003F401E89
MISFSFIPKSKEEENFFKVYETLKNEGVTGIETIIGDHLPLESYKKYPVKGVHLLYYPTWLEFWKEDQEKVREDFYNDEGILNYYRSFKKEILLKTFKKQFEDAKKIEAKYLVFHVSHVRPKHIFTFDFDYTSIEVLDETLKIVNEVFKGDGPLLLFENLPWPGLTLKDYQLTKYFFERVKYENKGFLLDLSHIICTERNINNFQEADQYIIKKIKNLGKLNRFVYGVHVNGIDFKNYLDKDFSKEIEEWSNGDRNGKFKIELEHMKNLDPHKVYKGDLKSIFNELPNLKYINLELNFSSLDCLEEIIKEQLNYIK